jgi:DNA repair protein RadD
MALRLTPRDYQVWSINKLLEWFGKHPDPDENPIIALPTGTGKSVVIAMLMEYIYSQWPNQKVVIAAHVKELVQQNYEELMGLWPTAPAGVYAAAFNKRDTHNRIIFGMMQSFAKKASSLFGHVDLFIVDECHLISPSEETMYQLAIKMLKAINPKMRVIGLTATPYRLGHGKLTENHLFTDICFDGTSFEAFNWFIDQGYLIAPVPGKTDTKIDLDGVHKRGGEFIESELQTAVDKHEITEPICREIVEYGLSQNRQSWIIFASGTEHSDHVAQCMNFLGVPTASVHSKMSGNRDDVIKAFKRGELRCLVNNNILTTGFNYKPIDLIAMIRPTESPGLWVQMLGRGTRPVYAEGFDLSTVDGRLASIAASQKQNCLVLDFAGNTRRLGPINDPVLPRQKGKGGGDAPVKECPQCGQMVHASLRFCNTLKVNGEKCGYEFPIQSKLHFTSSSAELVKKDVPVVEIFKVNHVTYSKHSKNNINMVKAVYYCGHKAFNEFICPEHPPTPDGRENFAKRKARQWWKARCGEEAFPESSDEILELAQMIPQATHLRVWTNKQYPEILATDLTGTAFGTQPQDHEKPDVDVAVTAGKASFHFIQNQKKEQAAHAIPVDSGKWDEVDDDIPF